MEIHFALTSLIFQTRNSLIFKAQLLKVGVYGKYLQIGASLQPLFLIGSVELKRASTESNGDKANLGGS